MVSENTRTVALALIAVIVVEMREGFILVPRGMPHPVQVEYT
jgi:hypothetical protein